FRVHGPRGAKPSRPHIGEYERKTNPVSEAPALRIGPARAVQPPPSRARLLVVGLQDLVAGGRKLRPVLLQAGQNGEITLIDDRTAELLHVARARLLLFRRTAALLLGEGRRRK